MEPFRNWGQPYQVLFEPVLTCPGSGLSESVRTCPSDTLLLVAPSVSRRLRGAAPMGAAALLSSARAVRAQRCVLRDGLPARNNGTRAAVALAGGGSQKM